MSLAGDLNAALSNATALASCVVGADGTVRTMSPGFAALVGAEADSGLGRPFIELLQAWEPSPADGPATVVRVGDPPVFAEIRTSSTRDGETIVALFDITEHRARQRELAEIAQFPDKNPGPVLWLDREATVLRANAAAKRAFGDDIAGSYWIDRCPGLTEEMWEAARASDHQVVYDVDLPTVCYAMTYVPSDGGEFVFTFGADITERRQAERRLAEVARFPDMNPGPVLRLDKDGTVLLANRAARDLFGEDIMDSSWSAVLPETAPRWDELRRSLVPVPIETRFGDRDYQFTHRFDRESNLLFVFGADITEQKRAERGIQQSERMATLGTLAAGIAHELNNPAAAARRAAEQLSDAFGRQQQAQFALDGIALDDGVRQRIQTLEAAARARALQPASLDAVERSDLEAAVEDWLDDHDVDDEWDLAPMLVGQGLDTDALDELIAGLDADAVGPVVAVVAAAFPVYRLAHEIGQASGRISEIVGAMKSYSYLGQAPRQEIDVHEGIDSTLIILTNKLKVGVTVKRDYCDDMPSIPAFGSELNQVWTNLLDNAVDAMEGTGTITITTSTEDEWGVVRICDTGPGIPADVRAHVFDPFFTTKEPGKGTGLGLATTYSIVTEKHGGEITVASEPGETCFTVRLPLVSKGD